MERRMERFLQEGQETCRHIHQIFVEYDSKICGGTCRWPLRRVLEEQQTWSAARARWGELGSLQAFRLVVEGGVRAVKADIEDLKAEAAGGWCTIAEAAEKSREASRLEHNLQHLQENVSLLQGVPEVKDLQAAMNLLVQEHQKAKGGAGPEACSSHQFYTAAVGFLSRDLPEPVEMKKVQTPGWEPVQPDRMQG